MVHVISNPLRDCKDRKKPHPLFTYSPAVTTNFVCMHGSVMSLCDAMDYSPPGSNVHGISQARIQDWVAISSSRGSSQPRDQTQVSCISCIGRRILYH